MIETHTPAEWAAFLLLAANLTVPPLAAVKDGLDDELDPRLLLDADAVVWARAEASRAWLAARDAVVAVATALIFLTATTAPEVTR